MGCGISVSAATRMTHWSPAQCGPSVHPSALHPVLFRLDPAGWLADPGLQTLSRPTAPVMPFKDCCRILLDNPLILHVLRQCGTFTTAAYVRSGCSGVAIPIRRSTIQAQGERSRRPEGNAMITQFDSSYAGHIDMENVGYLGTPVNSRRYSNDQLITAHTKAEAQAKVMDQLGFGAFWMAEHHFQPEGTECLPNIILLAVHLAHLTKRLKFHTG